LANAELYEHGVDVLQKVHDEIIMPMLRLLGFPNTRGIVETKECFSEIREELRKLREYWSLMQ